MSRLANKIRAKGQSAKGTNRQQNFSSHPIQKEDIPRAHVRIRFGIPLDNLRGQNHALPRNGQYVMRGTFLLVGL